MCFERAIDLPCDPTAVPQARRFAAEGSASWGIGPFDEARSAVDSLLLVTSELISNAVKACHRHVRLEIIAHHDRIVVSVADDSNELPVRHAPDERSESGRGIAIVDAVSSEWGVQPVEGGGGKVVWARIPIVGRTALSDTCRLAPGH